MPTIRAEEVRIRRQAREAVARHKEVVVTRERAAFVIVNPSGQACEAIEHE